MPQPQDVSSCCDSDEPTNDKPHATAPAAACGEAEDSLAKTHTRPPRRPPGPAKMRRDAAAAAKAVDARVWQATYPPPMAVPLGPDGFTLAFPCPAGPGCLDEAASAAILSFYEVYGFVVFRGALTPAECEASRAEVWDGVEKDAPGVSRADPSTWEKLSSETYGLAATPAVFTRQLLANRQNPRVVGALALLLGADVRPDADPRDGLLVSHDRFCLYRPTLAGALLPDAHPEWRTRENLHLDLHPWQFRRPDAAHRAGAEALRFQWLRDFSKETNCVAATTGPHLQGVVALAPNRPEDGGTVLVPGFAAAFDAWAEALGRVELHSDAAAEAARRAGDPTRPWLIGRTSGAGSFKFAPSDPLCALAQRVPLAEGDFLVWVRAPPCLEFLGPRLTNGRGDWRLTLFLRAWYPRFTVSPADHLPSPAAAQDQRTAHGARGNYSAVPRYAQFIKAFRTQHVSSARVRARAAAVERESRAAGTWETIITPLGRRVFGLEGWTCEEPEEKEEEAADGGEEEGGTGAEVVVPAENDEAVTPSC